MEYVPVSVGLSTESRFQIVRHMFTRFYPEEPANVVRWCVFGPDQANYVFEQNIFDDQITPSFAVSEYLEQDFKDIFELKDLEVTGDSLGVRNTQLLTYHPNLFANDNGVVTEANLRAGYPDAKAKMDMLVERFRAHLAAPEPRLYVLSEAPASDELMRIFDALSDRASHEFEILVHTRSIEAHANLPILPNVNSFLANDIVNKPPAHQWEGDDEEWDRALGHYRFAPVLKPRHAEDATPE